MGRLAVLWSVADWAEMIAALPGGGPLPTRTVLVPGEAVAHTLRRALIERGHAHALAGTRFLTLTDAATSVLHRAQVAFTRGEEALRPVRLLALFGAGARSGAPGVGGTHAVGDGGEPRRVAVPGTGDAPAVADLGLEHFPPALLRDRQGWDSVFADAIVELEAAGLRPDHLAAIADPRLRDVARIWCALDAAAGRSWTAARLVAEAAARLERDASLWPFAGPTLAAVTGHERVAEARFLRAIPDLTLGLLAARPLREHHLERVQALYGPAARRALLRPAPRACASERDLLASYLFEPPHVLADPARPRSAGPDDTVRLEEHDGLEAELEATADWVAEQIAAGIALEDIAVLVPTLDPLATLVADRLARLPWPGPGPALPVHVAGGLPLAATAAGARALAVVRALREHLAAAALAMVLPALRTVDADGTPGSHAGREPDDAAPPPDPAPHLTHGAATDLVWSLGTTGGNPTDPAGALDWAERLRVREPHLAAQLARARAARDDPERSGLARTARELERLLADLRAARPAIEALVGIARLVVGGAPLGELWAALRTFLATWLLQPRAGPRVEALLDGELARAAAAERALGGQEALAVVERAIERARVSTGRFGEPAVYVGTVSGAAGLRFAAVRVIGLAEGHLPPLVHEDPVLPDEIRVRHGLPTAADRALAALHALDRVVRATGRRVALSASRLDLERTQREPSAVLLEAAAALGRPHARTGAPGAVIPDPTALRRDAFAPARAAALAFRRAMPLGESAWQDGVAHRALGCPPHWRGSRALDLARLAALTDDGLLGPRIADVAVPGLTPDRPISATGLQELLRCPYRYFHHRVLGFDEPARAPALREIEQPAYGALVHAILEEFFRAHGPRFCAREGHLEAWLAAAKRIVQRRFTEFLEQYPLAGARIRAKERERLSSDVADLLRAEWDLGPRRFVAAEREFGRPAPVPLPLGARTLYVTGTVDRIDDDGRTLVRDLKTGRVDRRVGANAAPDPVGDLQIALYGLVAERLAAAWGTPPTVGVAYIGRHGAVRAFVDDFATVLAPAARAWLALAAELLATRLFPRTPSAEDCESCLFRPVCGDDAHVRAAMVLAAGPDLLARFRALKLGEAATGAGPAGEDEDD